MSEQWYAAHGLRIRSELPLTIPSCAPGAEPADVVVRLQPIDVPAPLVDSGASAKSMLRITPEEVCCRWAPAVTVLVRAGREIIVDPLPGADSPSVAAWVQGAAMSLILHQRGHLVLHSSAVEVNGNALVIVGEVGWGKSTTAAAIQARGHTLLTDDVIAVQFDGDGRPFVQSGLPHLKLMPQAVQMLGEDPESLPAVADDPEKRLRISRHQATDKRIPLSRIYILGEAETCRIEPLPPQVALPEMMHHAFVARSTDFLRLSGTTASHFANCTRVLQHARVCRLCRPKSFDKLPTLIDLIERDAGASAALSCAEQRA